MEKIKNGEIRKIRGKKCVHVGVSYTDGHATDTVHFVKWGEDGFMKHTNVFPKVRIDYWKIV